MSMIITYCRYCDEKMAYEITPYDTIINMKKYGLLNICKDCKDKIDKMNKKQKVILRI